MVYWYIYLLTLLNVKFIMLTNVRATGRISSFMKSLALPMCFGKALVGSDSVEYAISVDLLCDNSLANSAPPTNLRVVGSILHLEPHSHFVGHYRQEIKC